MPYQPGVRFVTTQILSAGLLAGLLTVGAVAGLLPNPDFEEGRDGALTFWQPAVPEKDGLLLGENIRVTWAAESHGAGQRCLKMETDGKSPEGYALIGSPRLRLLSGFDYEISFWYKAEGLLPESGDRKNYNALIMDLFQNSNQNKMVANCRILTYSNSAGWSRLAKTFTVAPGTDWAQVRLSLANKYANSKQILWWDDVALLPLDPTLPNVSVETGQENRPDGWTATGSGKAEWVTDTTRSGKRALLVADAGAGQFSGWSTEIPVRADRKYRFGGFIKGGDLKSDGGPAGGAFCLQFLDNQNQPLGEPVISPPIGANIDWTESVTRPMQAPPDAVSARLTAGLQFCRGNAWFDDLSLQYEETAAADVAKVTRQVPAPAKGIEFARNLIANDDLESGTDGKAANWTYVGRSEPDWKPEEIVTLHTEGRPRFGIGRGRGEWSHDLTYAGKGALLNISIDPPLSKHSQWYGRNPVDGYWLSDPMPCQPGKTYLSAAWIRPGAPIEEAWFGPLEIQFFGARGNKLGPKHFVRSSLSEAPAGVWTWWPSWPCVAPDGAVTMRLRFGQEFKADAGGWGRFYADNFAVWELPAGVPPPDNSAMLATERYREWFRAAHRALKPPYLPSPVSAVEYESAWGKMENLVTGNLYRDPTMPVPVLFNLTNLLGEDRDVTLIVTRTDWLGQADAPVRIEGIHLTGGNDTPVTVTLPPAAKSGAYHLDVEIREGAAKVGTFSGRYAILPSLERPRTAENIWGVTPLVQLSANGQPFEKELGELLQKAGFGFAWVRTDPFRTDPESVREVMAHSKRIMSWYRALGLRSVLQLMPEFRRPVDRAAYVATGKIIGEECKGYAAAYGNFAIETANSASPFRGGGAARMTDDEYDTILAGLYDGIKAADPAATVLIGNIATDWEGKTVRRLYGKPAEGRFDGAILNAYMGLTMTVLNNLKEFDAHGDKQKTIWQEENADQRSPINGDARRYGEGEGAKNMVRSWLAVAAKANPRIKALTMWGFVTTSEQDINMVNPNLQPRPQYVAMAVMTDALADAAYSADRSTGNLSWFEWQRGGGPLAVLWANAGELNVTLEAPAGKLTVMDLMGNRAVLEAKQGLIPLTVTTTPIYLFGGGNVTLSKLLELRLAHGSRKAGQTLLRLTVKNNAKTVVEGKVTFVGPVEGGAQQSITLEPGAEIALEVPVKPGLEQGKRSVFRADCVTAAGAVFSANAGLNFAQAVRAAKPPTLDGTWKDWSTAPVITFAEAWQVEKPGVPDESYTGPADISGKLRFLWDDQFLYLGVEALDDVFSSVPDRGRSGFMGDSIEFGVQPENILAPMAPYWEYELYLPGDKGPWAASRRFPMPYAMVENWKANVVPTGVRGNVNYQAAIPWADLGISKPALGKTFSLAVVLNDADRTDRFAGSRCRIRWFEGVDNRKNPEGFGDVTLVEP